MEIGALSTTQGRLYSEIEDLLLQIIPVAGVRAWI